MAHKYGFASVNSQLNSGRDNQTETQKQMATIVQRTLNNSGGEESMGITEEEKNQLMEELDKLNENFEEKKDGK